MKMDTSPPTPVCHVAYPAGPPDYGMTLWRTRVTVWDPLASDAAPLEGRFGKLWKSGA
jgi:hypothetical protein